MARARGRGRRLRIKGARGERRAGRTEARLDAHGPSGPYIGRAGRTRAQRAVHRMAAHRLWLARLAVQRLWLTRLGLHRLWLTWLAQPEAQQMPDRNYVSRLYIHVFFCNGPNVLEPSGPSRGCLGPPEPDPPKAAYAASADAHLGVLGRPGAFWGALERPEASWGVPKVPGPF